MKQIIKLDINIKRMKQIDWLQWEDAGKKKKKEEEQRKSYALFM